LVSVAYAGLWAFWGTLDKQCVDEVKKFYFISLIISSFLLLVGWQTYRLFISRWRLTIIFLRKLARIRKWFLELDPVLESGLTYGTDETKPSFLSRPFFSSSLLTLVAIINCIFMVIVILMSILLIFSPLTPIASYILICLFSALVTLFLQYRIFVKAVTRLERDKFAAFPVPIKNFND